MQYIETEISDLIVLEPDVYRDDRGYFFESYNKKDAYQQYNLEHVFIQDNHAHSTYGVIRGLHYQSPFSQTKLIRVINGIILDVAVDLRPNSITFGKIFSIVLSAENKKQLLIPRGFAHGYSVLSDFADVSYKCDEIWDPKGECGIIYNDPTLNIDWKIPTKDIKISLKDSMLPQFDSFL